MSDDVIGPQTSPLELEHPTEAQRAVRAVCLGAALGAILAVLSWVRRDRG